MMCDEIAGMELCSKKLQAVAQEPLHCPTPLLGTIQRKPHPFLNQIRQLSSAGIIEVNATQRSELPKQLLDLIASTKVRPPQS